jgi:1-acyl-sn-glycerol-3-phosphate acyltransferase
VRLPPRWVRRIVLWPLPLLLVWVYLATIPLLLIVAFVLSYKLPGKLRAVRSLGLLTVYAFVEVAVLVSGFALWVASGFGRTLRSERSLDRHYRLLAWALRVLVGAGTRLFVVRIDAHPVGEDPVDDLEEATGSDVPEGARPPLIVMSRHAGPADSILLLHEIAGWAGRRPRIVLKEKLQLDPAFDLLLNRLPNRFVGASTHGTPATELIGELVADMGGDDAFVIFPEGGNFTTGRRERAIAHLEEQGDVTAAERARGLRNVLPPRLGGTLAALEACPDAGAVFVAHTGLDEIAGVRDLWRSIPDHKVLQMVWRVIPSSDVPTDDTGRTELLWRAWEAIDDWIEGAKSTPAGPIE